MAAIIAKRALVAHPDGPRPGLSLGAKLSWAAPTSLAIEYVVGGALDDVRWPAAAQGNRTDDLWRTTCFELFVAGVGSKYLEYNFSSSGNWASYRFDGYRSGMAEGPSVEPAVAERTTGQRFGLHAKVDISRWGLAAPLRLALSAVIEETDGSKSYWALHHPPGKPDFHHPDCFVIDLPPAS